MPRAPRIWFPGAVYHIIQRGNNQQEIFKEDSDYRWFLNIVRQVKNAIKFKIYLYVLMKNHYHMTIETTDVHISEIMHSINSTYVIRFNKKYQRQGHLFQGRFKSVLVDKDNYLLELSRYIHLNPVKAGLVKYPEEYGWSSYRDYLGKENCSLVDCELILSQFSSAFQDTHKRYTDFVNDRLELIRTDEDWLKGNMRRQRFLGDKNFVKLMLKKRLTPFEKSA